MAECSPPSCIDLFLHRPLYRSLHKSKMGNKVAAETFKKHRDSYHPIAAKMIAADLGV
jgi:leukotriene-A4 hydrolase